MPKEESVTRAVLSAAVQLGLSVASLYVAYVATKRLLENRDAAQHAKKESIAKNQLLSSRPTMRQKLAQLSLDEHECEIVKCVVAPSQIDVRLSDVGGLEPVKRAVEEVVILPFTRPELFEETGLGLIRGLLLYGPPGTGKTMIAKAIAKESGATFISVDHGALKSKWVGESEKYVNALFSLAAKLEPCIIFIDEIDALLGTRSAMDHQTTGAVKAGILSNWDGLRSSDESRVIVVGATNRPSDIDLAVLRRLPRKFMVPVPDEKARASILRLILSKKCVEPNFDYDAVAAEMDHFSGSDIKQLCKIASLRSIRAFLEQERKFKEGKTNAAPKRLPPLTTVDLLESIPDIVPCSRSHALGSFV